MNLETFAEVIQNIDLNLQREELANIIQPYFQFFNRNSFNKLTVLVEMNKAPASNEKFLKYLKALEIVSTGIRFLEEQAFQSAIDQGITPITSTPILWTQTLRRKLALWRYHSSFDFLSQAIDEARKEGEMNVVSFLELWYEVDELGKKYYKISSNNDASVENLKKQITELTSKLFMQMQKLSDHFNSVGRAEEHSTLELCKFSSQIVQKDNIHQYPPEYHRIIFDKTILQLQECIVGAKLLNDIPCEAMFFNLLGETYWEVDNEKSEWSLRNALTLYRDLAAESSSIYTPDLAVTINNLGIVLNDRRKFGEAEVVMKESLVYRRSLAENDYQNYAADVAATAGNMGNVLTGTRRIIEAEKFYREAIDISRSLIDESDFLKSKLGFNLMNLAMNLGHLQRYSEAESVFQEALSIYRSLSNPDFRLYLREISSILGSLAIIFMILDRLNEAEKNIWESYEIEIKLFQTNPEMYAGVLSNTLTVLGNIFTKSDKFSEAENAYRQALKLCELVDLPIQTIISRSNLGQLKMHQKKWREAITELEEALIGIEGLRKESYSPERARQIVSENIKVYENLVVCLMRKEIFNVEKALEVSEQGKSRSIIDLLLQQEQNFKFNASEVRNDYLQAQSINTDEIKNLAKQSKKTFVALRFSDATTYIFFVFPDGEVSSMILNDFTSESLKQLFVKSEHNSQDNEISHKGWQFNYELYKQTRETVIAAKQNFENDSSPQSEKDLIEKLDKYERARKQWFDEMEFCLSELYQKVFKFIHLHLKEKSQQSKLEIEEIVIIPNRYLSALPVQACWWEENGARHYLIDYYDITVAPSISVFHKCWKREQNGRAKKTLLTVANPQDNLPFSEKECDEIEKILEWSNIQKLRGKQASKDNIITFANKQNVLHFSCHGIYNQSAPFESSLFVTSYIFNKGNIADRKQTFNLTDVLSFLDLKHTWLTVLAACETGLSDVQRMDDEFYGFPVCFIIVGTPTVWATLWSVRDDTSFHLMTKAYLNLKNRTKSQALRDAQLEIRNSSPEYSHPYFWAGFQNFGA